MILKFPKSKRKLTTEEEKIVRCCANIIYNTQLNSSPFISPEQKIMFIEEQLRSLIKKVYTLDEDK